MRIALNESGSFGFSKKLKMSFTCWLLPKCSGWPGLRLAAYGLRSLEESRRRRSFLRGWDHRRLLGRRLHQLDVETERLQLLDEHVERLGQSRLERVLALHDRFVHAGAADHVVRLHRQELLQR